MNNFTYNYRKTVASQSGTPTIDFGPNPFSTDITKATLENDYYRTTLWTGHNLQVTLMTIEEGDDIGLEVHPDNDQFIRIEQGQGEVQMGTAGNNLSYKQKIYDDYAIFVPAGTWHNIINTGTGPLKLYSVYAPPHHPVGTVHETKEIAQEMED